jgi:NAD(P)-dependent dehydrogenase (short-subunit alcohol dehydrogenase family)
MTDRDDSVQEWSVVTGASAGIGLAIIDQMLADGQRVIALSRRAPPRSHPGLLHRELDLIDVAATERLAASLGEEFRVTRIVHNAGAMRPALLPEAKTSDLRALVELHLAGPMALTQAFLPGMRASGHGRVVFVSSRAALGLATRTAYSATKAGIHGMARTWALELGAEGITVNVVAPGPILTDMFHEVIPEDSPRIAQIAQNLPVKRLGRADDVARAVAFFLSPQNGFITGQVLYVCGGASIGSITF